MGMPLEPIFDYGASGDWHFPRGEDAVDGVFVAVLLVGVNSCISWLSGFLGFVFGWIWDEGAMVGRVGLVLGDALQP